MARYKGNHYSTDKARHQKAVERSRKTIHEKFGVKGYSELRRNACVQSYVREAAKLEEADIVSKKEVIKFLSIYDHGYFKGRAGNRTMKKVNLAMYKSLMHHTDEFSVFYNNRSIPFSGRIDIALKGFKLEDSDLCYCGSRIKFDPRTQDWTKLYCVQCRMTGTSKPHFKFKYGDEWEKLWKERNVSGAITRGKNEETLLSKIEESLSVTIDREYRLLNFYPDGYCKENNTIYEVYEAHHKKPSYLEKDKMRQQIIQDYLKCDFCIIWDDGSDRIELYKYVQTK